MYYARVLLIVFISSSFVDSVVYQCTTPDKEQATCISIFYCPGLMKSLATLQPSALEYFRKSMCLGCKVGSFMVCCSNANRAKANTSVAPRVPQPKYESKRAKVLRTLIPSTTYCGLQHTDDRFYNNPETALDEFPWLVHIKFTDIYSEYKFGDRCTGVLINSRYVLTDTVCGEPAKKVRLGQYNVAHRVTCIQNPQAHECNEGTIEIRIEKKIALQPQDSFGLYTLTLIRLAQNVEYSDFVRPICLPLMEAHRPTSQQTLTFSGWGAKPTAKVVEDAIKKRLVYKMINSETCAQNNDYRRNSIRNNVVPLNCFQSLKSNIDTACVGDHGGPLMFSSNKHQWYVEYIVVEVSFSQSGEKCDKNGSILAARITPNVIATILDNIEA